MAIKWHDDELAFNWMLMNYHACQCNRVGEMAVDKVAIIEMASDEIAVDEVTFYEKTQCNPKNSSITFVLRKTLFSCSLKLHFPNSLKYFIILIPTRATNKFASLQSALSAV